jgi:hypothetical protein
MNEVVSGLRSGSPTKANSYAGDTSNREQQNAQKIRKTRQDFENIHGVEPPAEDALASK